MVIYFALRVAKIYLSSLFYLVFPFSRIYLKHDLIIMLLIPIIIIMIMNIIIMVFFHEIHFSQIILIFLFIHYREYFHFVFTVTHLRYLQVFELPIFVLHQKIFFSPLKSLYALLSIFFIFHCYLSDSFFYLFILQGLADNEP